MSESLEIRALLLYMADSGVRHRCTSTTTGGHAAGSYHYRDGTDGDGLAADFAGPVPSRDSAQLLAVYKALEPLGPHVAELIYAGPGGGYWKNGRRVAPYAASSHHNHIHIAVPKGTLVRRPSVPDEKPVIKVNAAPVSISVTAQGGYVILCADGGVITFGPGAEYHGRVTL